MQKARASQFVPFGGSSISLKGGDGTATLTGVSKRPERPEWGRSGIADGIAAGADPAPPELGEDVVPQRLLEPSMRSKSAPNGASAETERSRVRSIEDWEVHDAAEPLTVASIHSAADSISKGQSTEGAIELADAVVGTRARNAQKTIETITVATRNA
jgi:hypothetical protein